MAPVSGQGGVAFHGSSTAAFRPERKRLGTVIAEWDCVILLALILANIRVFQGSSIASFTLYELFVWCYCVPVVISHMLATRFPFSETCGRFLFTIFLYLLWILFASLSALLFRQHPDVLQQAKNIVPCLPLACFILIRVRRQPGMVAKLANFYVLYCIADCALALIQFRQGGPYLRPTFEGNDYKLDFNGNTVSNLVLGTSGTPNELAVVVLPGLMFSAVKLVYEVRAVRLPRVRTLACFVLTAIPFFLSESRGALIWFVFGLIFTAVRTRRSQSFAIKLVLVSIVIAASVAYGLRASSGDPSIENTVLARYLLWKTSLDAMMSDVYIAVLGDGIDYVKFWSLHVAGWQFEDAHNGWIDQALFFGIPALLIYLLIWQRFFAIVDAAANLPAISERITVLLDSIRGAVLSYMGLYFFEPVAHAVFPVSQLFLLMSCGVGLSSLLASNGMRARRPAML